MTDKDVKVERSAGAILFRRQGGRVWYVLLQYATRNHWTFPRGRLEEGERPIDAARREIEEETGISRVKFIPGYKETIHFRYQWPPKTEGAEQRLKFITFYLGEVFGRTIKISEEHKNFVWAPYEKAMKIIKHKNSRELLKKANLKIMRMGEKKPPLVS
ncbi:MAG: NUDIX domain-containing protein [Patescibacteria group bacterium]